MRKKLHRKATCLLLAVAIVVMAAGSVQAAARVEQEILNFDRSIKDSVDNFRILRTTTKAEMNDYVTRVFELKNAKCMELIPFVRAAVRPEAGTAFTLKYTDPQTKKQRNFIQVVCPRFQVAGIEQLIKAYDLPGVVSSPGDTRYFYRLQHRNAADVNTMLAASERSGDGASAVDEATNTIYYRDSASDFSRGLAVIKFMDVPIPQVELEIEIFELDRADEDKLGLYWDAWKGAIGGGVLGYGGSLAASNGGYEVLAGIGSTAAAQFLNYLVQEGVGKVVTKARVSVQNRQTATISSLKRIPYQAYNRHSCNVFTPEINTNVDLHVLADQTAANQPGGANQRSTIDPGTVTGEKSEGIYLRVTPTLGVRTLSADIIVTVNSLVGFTKLDMPIITERRIATTATLTPGKIFVLGGMDKETMVKESRGIPGLRHIPGLKYLFSYEVEVARKSVLIITIKPTIKNQLLYKALGLEGAVSPAAVDIDKDQRLILDPHPAANEPGDDIMKGIDDLGPALKWGKTQWGCPC